MSNSKLSLLHPFNLPITVNSPTQLCSRPTQLLLPVPWKQNTSASYTHLFCLHSPLTFFSSSNPVHTPEFSSTTILRKLFPSKPQWLHLILIRMAIIKQTKQNITSVDENVEDWNPCTLLVRNRKCKLLCKPVWQFLKKRKIELPYDPEILLLDIYPKEVKAVTQTDSCTPRFTAVLFTLIKR